MHSGFGAYQSILPAYLSLYNSGYELWFGKKDCYYPAHFTFFFTFFCSLLHICLGLDKISDNVKYGFILVCTVTCAAGFFVQMLRLSYYQYELVDIRFPATPIERTKNKCPLRTRKTDNDLFDVTFQTIKEDILNDMREVYSLADGVVDWTANQIDYNCIGGKFIRGKATLNIHNTLSKSQGIKITEKRRYQAAILGWCTEFLNACFLVSDDLTDASLTRRGQPCYFRLPQVGNIAINDAGLLENFVYKILKQHFGGESYYNQLIDLFHEVTYQTELGQQLDLTSYSESRTVDLSKFTTGRFHIIAVYKTAFYTFYLPLALAMIMTGIKDKMAYDKVRMICRLLGEYYQAQNDYLDCYGDANVIGKTGTDIEENKCSWLILQALSLASPEQRLDLEENYGRWDEESVRTVKGVFNDLKIPSLFEQYDQHTYQQICSLIEDIPEIPREVFDIFLKLVFNRKNDKLYILKK